MPIETRHQRARSLDIQELLPMPPGIVAGTLEPRDCAGASVSSTTMFDPEKALLSRFLSAIGDELAADPASPQAWAKAAEALGASRATEPELARIIDARDAAALRAQVAAWASGASLLPEQDRAVLKHALKAFRKSLKVTRLDEESSIGGGAMSSGRHSGIVGITPPSRFPREVWDELVRQGKLIDGKHGIYELPRE